jgi:hypothetical protein
MYLVSWTAKSVSALLWEKAVAQCIGEGRWE